MSISFLLTSLVVVMTPGTGVVYTLATGLSRGTRASIVAAIGCTLGIVPHMLAAVTGLAALLNASPLAFEIMRYLGVAYLFYMAWSVLREKGGLSIDDQMAPQSARKVITTAVLINILNPKLTIFFVAFLPQFVHPEAPNALVQMLGLSLVFMILTLVVFVAYGKFASSVRGQLASRPSIMSWLRRAFAVAFVALAARLALT